MTQRWGSTLARQLAAAFKAPVANTAAITAIAAADRQDGMLVLETTSGGLWFFDDDGAAGAGPTVLSPDAGSGQWLSAGGGGGAGVGVGSIGMSTVLCRTTAALDASTTTGTVMTRTGVGALGAHDGVTPVAGETILVANEAGGDAKDNGPYVVTDAGGATAWVLTRVATADTSAEVTAGMLHYVSEGTLFGNEWAYLTNDDAITLDTTLLAYAMIPNLVDLASVANGLGASLLGLEDTAGNLAATDVEAGIAEIFTLLASVANLEGASLVGVEDPTGLITATDAEAALVELAGDIDTLSPGAPMQGRLIALGAPAKLVQGDTVTIGSDVYEFRDSSSPPTGGTAGRIWVFNGANSLDSRTNLVNAINNVTDAAAIAYDGAVTESMLAALDPVTTGHVTVVSATAIGGTAAPSATATAVSTTLSTGTDIWDEATLVGGYVQADSARAVMKTVTVLAQHITAATIEFEFDFTPLQAIIINNNRSGTDVWTIVGNSVSVTLAGGGAPATQANDVLTCLAQG